MRWFRKRRIQHDPARQQVMLRDVRERYGPKASGRPLAEQANDVAHMLNDPDGIVVAAFVLREFADAAYHDVAGQCRELGLTPDRRAYRPLWEQAGKRMRSPLFASPGGFHPYVHVAGAVTLLGIQSQQTVRVINPLPMVGHLFEILDLTLAGWEFGRVLVDVDGATLATQLITTATEVRGAMTDPPPIPPPARAQMRRNNSVDVLDPAISRIVGKWNPGQQMRESLLA
ncbi:hypothetical protein [Actinoplanes sp. NPDC051851]|uniref:hypothetical protein n=1 Tax=Actinoplanes sp. NPDC051851 TaxID=3154753 RepID=UPI0034224288